MLNLIMGWLTIKRMSRVLLRGETWLKGGNGHQTLVGRCRFTEKLPGAGKCRQVESKTSSLWSFPLAVLAWALLSSSRTVPSEAE